MGRDDELRPDERLHFVHIRRLDHAWTESSDGARAFVIYYGDKEIEFDDPRDFGFAEALVRRPSFVAGDACDWSNEGAAAWERLRGYLEALIDEGVLARDTAEREDVVPGEATTGLRYRATPLTWSASGDACEQLARELAGADFGVAHVESMVPVNDLARPAIDETGRQVGESNVDERLRVRIPTEWATCRYPGSRYVHACPMNVSALRKVNGDWDVALATLAELRMRFVAALGLPDGARLSLGDAHMFAMLTLAWSGHLMVRPASPTPSGALPSVASSLFMLTDGIRMTTAHLLHDAAQPRHWDDVVDPAAFVRVTDREQLLIGPRGVCAGPPGKLEAFVTAVLDGGGDPGDSQLGRHTPDIDGFFTYAARAIRATVVGRMLVAHTEQSHAVIGAWAAALDPAEPLAARLRAVPRPATSWPPGKLLAAAKFLARAHAEAGRLATIEPAPALELPAPTAERVAQLDAELCSRDAAWARLPAPTRAPACTQLAAHQAMCEQASVRLTALQRAINRDLGRRGAAVTIDAALVHAHLRLARRVPDLLAAPES